MTIHTAAAVVNPFNNETKTNSRVDSLELRRVARISPARRGLSVFYIYSIPSLCFATASFQVRCIYHLCDLHSSLTSTLSAEWLALHMFFR
jgi:hypothetical protein